MAFLRMDLPPIDLHASTQMCTTTPEQVRFLADVGFSRVVLERAMTLQEIEKLSQAADVEIEAFIHGALCVSYSGRCYMSRTMSARSGNGVTARRLAACLMTCSMNGCSRWCGIVTCSRCRI